MRNEWIVVAALCLGGAQLAHAQGLVEQAANWSWPESATPPGLRALSSSPSAGERRYASGLARAFEEEATSLVRVGATFRAPHEGSPTYTARGVRVQLADGTDVERLQFASDQAAFEYALYGAHLDAPGSEALVEARGRQVVVVRGPGLDDPHAAAHAFDAAWSGLPAPAGQPTVTASMLSSGTAITARRRDPVLDGHFDRALAASGRQIAQGNEHVHKLEEGGYGFQFEGGVNGEIRDAAGLRTLFVANTPADADALRSHQERALQTGATSQQTDPKQPDPKKPTLQAGAEKPLPKKPTLVAGAKKPLPERQYEGTAQRLGGLFGD